MSNYIVSDTSLSSIADAIRNKTGSNEQLVFPNGFVSEIENISGGGTGVVVEESSDQHGGTVKNIVAVDLSEDTVDAEHLASGYTAHDKDGNAVVGNLVEEDIISELAERTLTSITSNFENGIHSRLFQYQPIESINLPNALHVPSYMCADCNYLENINLPKLVDMPMCAFQNCTILEVVVLPSFQKYNNNGNFEGCTSLHTIDYASTTIDTKNFFSQKEHNNNSSLTTVVIRATNVVAKLGNLNNFDGTPFASNGTGGILYVPESLVSSYQSATNWSTILGYTNNQIKSIESTHTNPNASIDLTLYYADGTPIPSN